MFLLSQVSGRSGIHVIFMKISYFMHVFCAKSQIVSSQLLEHLGYARIAIELNVEIINYYQKSKVLQLQIQISFDDTL